MRPSRTTEVSPPRTGRSPAAGATERALPRACSRTGSEGAAPGGSCSSYEGAATSKGIPSCSRIARRWGEVEARRIGGGLTRRDDQAASFLPHLPDVLHRPSPRPLRLLRAPVRRGRAFRGTDLAKLLDGEARGAEEADPLAVGQVGRLRRAHSRRTRARSPARPTRASPIRARGCPAWRARGHRGSS